MADNVEIDDRDFQKRISDYARKVVGNNRLQATHNVATEILRLSSREVPHDKGTLQNSGSVQDHEEESIVGYHTPYAARLHENPQYRYQKGRKGKFLEDPIKKNTSHFNKYFKDMLSGR